jgi:PAS domain S-box-containing protein
MRLLSLVAIVGCLLAVFLLDRYAPLGLGVWVLYLLLAVAAVGLPYFAVRTLAVEREALAADLRASEDRSRKLADIAEQNRVARQRDAVAHRLRLILDRMPIGCVITDPTGHISGWNAAAERTFGFSAADVLGRTPDETFASPRARGYLGDLLARLRAGQEVRGTHENRTKDGRAIWCEWHNTPLFDEDGVYIGSVAMAVDVTERRKSEQALRALSKQVLTVQEQERRALARELHDEVGQVLTAVAINLQTLTALCPPEARPTLDDSAAIVAEAIRQVRGLSLDLRPPMLDDFGLAAAVKWYADQQARRAGLPITVELSDTIPRLPAELEAGCFRVVQEAVTNALRHAQATTIRIRLVNLGGELLLEVADDGAGFDPTTTNGGFGLTGMSERAELLGGALSVVSVPGRGTTITLRAPVVTTAESEP